ncbi:MAG: isoprenoid biosynthesis glyoxalase ElbB [Flavobacteriia bacterium]|nr:isoprenoid biosynthesis glyoxalase ElbB [Flavobacteriia bacterium]
MKIAVLLSGCGVYDGAEIQESVLSLLAIEEEGHQAQCFSLDENQFHVVNHLNGEEMNEKRNMLIESARISRGNSLNLSSINLDEWDVLLIPGGFGSAKNFSDWAFNGTQAQIHPLIKKTLVGFYELKKPIVALCVSPILLAKAFENTSNHLNITLGTNSENSPYDIQSFHQSVESLGCVAHEKTVREVLVDKENKIITAPCYMMETSILEIRKAISLAVKELKNL